MDNQLQYARDVSREMQAVRQRLTALIQRASAENDRLKPSARVTEHLLHGAGRRLSMIRRGLENIFTLFPPDIVRPLPQETVLDAQINLHTLLVNAHATSDNWAWAFVLRHELDGMFPKKTSVGLFLRETRKYFSPPLSEYLHSERLTRWRTEYATLFRDATAHRIPPYIPPYVVLEEDQPALDELDRQQHRAMLAHDWRGVDAIEEQKKNIHRPAAFFVNSLGADDATKKLHLHAQVVADAMTVAEIGEMFLDHWKDCVRPRA